MSTETPVTTPAAWQPPHPRLRMPRGMPSPMSVGPAAVNDPHYHDVSPRRSPGVQNAPVSDPEPPDSRTPSPEALDVALPRTKVVLDRSHDAPSCRPVEPLQVVKRTPSERNGSAQRSSSRFTSSRPSTRPATTSANPSSRRRSPSGASSSLSSGASARCRAKASPPLREKLQVPGRSVYLGFRQSIHEAHEPISIVFFRSGHSANPLRRARKRNTSARSSSADAPGSLDRHDFRRLGERHPNPVHSALALLRHAGAPPARRRRRAR